MSAASPGLPSDLEARLDLIGRAFRLLLVAELRRMSRARHQARVEGATERVPKIEAEIAAAETILHDWDELEGR